MAWTQAMQRSLPRQRQRTFELMYTQITQPGHALG